METIPTDFVQFLAFLATPTIGAVLTSWLLSKIPAFEAQDTFNKKVWSVGASFVVGAVLYAFNLYFPASWATALTPFFKAGMLVTFTVLATQTAHGLTKPTNTKIDWSEQ